MRARVGEEGDAHVERIRDLFVGRRLPLLVFVIIWAGVLALTVVTWQTDPSGYSIGLHPGMIAPHLLLPVLLGVTVAWRRHALSAPPSGTCAWMGLVFGVAHAAAWWVMDVAWLPAVAEPASTWAEALGMATGYAMASIVLCVAGGWAARALGSLGRHQDQPTQRGEAADPAAPDVLAGENPRRISDLLR